MAPRQKNRKKQWVRRKKKKDRKKRIGFHTDPDRGRVIMTNRKTVKDRKKRGAKKTEQESRKI